MRNLVFIGAAILACLAGWLVVKQAAPVSVDVTAVTMDGSEALVVVTSSNRLRQPILLSFDVCSLHNRQMLTAGKFAVRIAPWRHFSGIRVEAGASRDESLRWIVPRSVEAGDFLVMNVAYETPGGGR